MSVAKVEVTASDFIDADIAETAKKAPKAEIGKLADLLVRSGIDIDDVAKINRVNLWQGFHKDENGDAHIVDLAGIQLVPSWDTGPLWPVVAPSAPINIKGPRAGAPLDGAWKTAVVLPDIQIGYYRDLQDGMHPTHDEAALDVALQVTKAAKPHLVVLVGDNLDFPEIARFRRTPAFQRTTQATIDRAGLFVAQLRAAAPDAIIIWLAGNHEERLPNYLLDNAMAAFGLRKANSPKSWPVLSVPELCRLDDHDVTFIPGYPASHYWINDRLKVIHGDKVTSNGSTAHKYLGTERVSVIYGHVHRREWAERTREGFGGPRTIMAFSPGCLCRVDGKVPSTKSGTDLDGIPMARVEDWQTGLAVISYEEGDGRFVPDQIPIHDGFALWRGKEYAATVGIEGKPLGE